MALRRNTDGRAEALADEVGALRRELADLHTAVRDSEAARAAAHVALVEEIQGLHNHRTVQLERIIETQALLLEAARAATDDDAGTRRRLAALRATQEYDAAFTDERPLVSIVMPTYDNAEGLLERSVPSALNQTHDHVEVIVVGDAAGQATGAALATIEDDRLRYENLAIRGPYSDVPKALWYTAGIPPLNRAMALARGQWIAVLNDDDAFRPDFVQRLLAHARSTRAEVAYGKLLHHEPERDPWELGAFPPQNHAFGWQMALQHGGLRMYGYEMHAPVFDEPGDWHRASRMLRTGVRFSMLDAVVGDYWPSTLWRGRRT